MTSGSSCSARASSGPRGDLGTVVGPGPCVLLLDGLADGGDPAFEELLGDRELLGLEGGQGGVAVGGGGGEPARRGPVHPTRGRRAGPGRSASGRRPRPAAPDRRRGPAERESLRGPRSPPSPRGPAVGRPAGPVPRPVGPVVPPALGLGGQDHVDVRTPLGGAEDLDALDGPGLALALGGQRAVTVVPSRVVSTSARSTVPTTDPCRDQRGVDRAPGLLGPGGAPRPRGVPGLTGEFDFDAMGHTGRQATAADTTIRHVGARPAAKKGVRTP